MTVMKYAKTLALLLLPFAIPAAAQPVVAAAVNSASYIHAGLPNAGIAQGSLFVLFGSGMGPSTLQQISTFPLSATFGGTSVSVTSGGQTVACYMIYTSVKQVAAILPSSTPIGSGTVTVTYNGQASAPAPIQVVANSFGIFAVNQAGSGIGVFTDANYHAASLTASAESGETWIIWGTGLGAVSGDEAGGPLPGDMPNLPVKVYVGTQQATVVYRGRSGCCSGVDQIAFKIPSGITGCNVPVALQVGNTVSNFVSLPIASGSRTCSDPSGFTADELTKFSGQGNIKIASIALSRVTASITLPPPLGTGQATTYTIDEGVADFNKYNFTQLDSAQSQFNINTYGTCSVYTFTGESGTEPTVTAVGLNAGASIAVNGPNGTKQMTPLASEVGLYSAQLGGGVPGTPNVLPLYLSQGAYTITGPGGADVGSFTANLSVPESLVWTNQASTTTVTRSQGLPITWTGADSGTVQISGFSLTGLSSTTPYGAGFVCTAKGSDHQFTVPSIVLLSLPPSDSVADLPVPTGSLIVGSITPLQSFTASGIDKGFIAASTENEQSVTYQ